MSTVTEEVKKPAEIKRIVAGASTEVYELHKILLLMALRVAAKSDSHYFGVKEEDWRAIVKIHQQEDFDRALSTLLREKIVSHQFCQEGSAGPFAHRYRVIAGTTITVEWTPE